jgi:hypothetical protein
MAANHRARSRRRQFSLLHIVGGVTGGAIAASLVAAILVVGRWLGFSSEIQAAGLLAAGAFGLATLGLPAFRRLRRLAPRRQVPQAAGGFLEPGALGFAYGIGLGFGLATFAPIMVPQALAGLCLGVGGVPATYLAFGAYGLSRGVAPIAAIWLQPSPSVLGGVIDRTFDRLRVATGLLVLVAAASATIRVP